MSSVGGGNWGVAWDREPRRLIPFLVFHRPLGVATPSVRHHNSLLEQIAEQGLGILPELVRIVVNTAMQAEREAYLGAVNLAIRPLILLAVMREGFIVSLIGPLR